MLVQIKDHPPPKPLVPSNHELIRLPLPVPANLSSGDGDVQLKDAPEHPLQLTPDENPFTEPLPLVPANISMSNSSSALPAISPSYHDNWWFPDDAPVADDDQQFTTPHEKRAMISPLAVIMVCPDPSPRDPAKHQIQTNTLRLWASITSSRICLLVFLTSASDAAADLVNFELAPQWPCVRNVTSDQYRVNPHGTPVFPSLMHTAQSMFDQAALFWYLNSDIILPRNQALGLLQAVLSHSVNAAPDMKKGIKWSPRNSQRTLLVGRRWNIQWQPEWQVLPNGTKTFSFADLQSGASSSQLAFQDAIDYFLMTRNIWRWLEFPELVIGRPAYDNYIVARALKDPSVHMIDATPFAFAVHQTDLLGKSAAKSRNPPDLNWNRQTLKTKTAWGPGLFGMTKSSHILTRCPSVDGRNDQQKGRVCVMERPPSPPQPPKPKPKPKPKPPPKTCVGSLCRNSQIPNKTIIGSKITPVYG